MFLFQGYRLYNMLIPFKDYSFLKDADDIERWDSLQGLQIKIIFFYSGAVGPIKLLYRKATFNVADVVSVTWKISLFF